MQKRTAERAVESRLQPRLRLLEATLLSCTYLAHDSAKLSYQHTHIMPPTLLSRRVLSSISNPTPLSVPTFLLPFLHRQRRTASILGSLSDTPGSYNKRIRRGRGPSSGKGKTSGRGHKGQKQHGKVPANFNGGQTPDFVVHGKYGFVNP